MTTKVEPRQSRAVERLIQAGSLAYCHHCDDRIKFAARRKAHVVVCNVYEDGVWKRVESFHAVCYVAAGEPYGPADASQLLPLTAAQRRAKPTNTEDD